MAVMMPEHETQGAFRVGVQHRLFHLGLRRWREEHGITQRQLSAMAGLSPQRITTLEAFRAFPSERERAALSEITGIDPDVLFPAWVREWVTGEAKVATTEHEITPAMLPGRDRLMLASAEDIEAVECDVDQGLLKRATAAQLETLTPRESRVLQLRFGMDRGQPRTYDEVAHEFGVTKERIRQIEAKALRKLRHPQRTKSLKPFMDWAERSTPQVERSRLQAFIYEAAHANDPSVTPLASALLKSVKACEGCRTWSVSGLREHVLDDHKLRDAEGAGMLFDRLEVAFKASLRGEALT